MSHKSDNETPDLAVPQHVAIIMDGNGRWAKKRFLPRIAGHRAGVDAVRKVVEACAVRKIPVLTLFAFSSENWRRPKAEVGLLMDLFITALEKETQVLNKNNVKLRVIGDRSAFSDKLQQNIEEAESLTSQNTGLVLNVAANYGGRWDIAQATRKVVQEVKDGVYAAEEISEQTIAQHLAFNGMPDPDLFIRTGGEQRISNFLLWQLAYTELHFTELNWPDFNDVAFDEAVNSFQNRERRFGRTSEQVQQGA